MNKAIKISEEIYTYNQVINDKALKLSVFGKIDGIKHMSNEALTYLGFKDLELANPNEYQHIGELYEDENIFKYTLIDFTEDEIKAYDLSLVPKEITLRQLRLQMLEDSISNETVLALIDSIPDETQKERTLIEWTYATTFYRSNTDIIMMWSALGYSEKELNEFFINASNK